MALIEEGHKTERRREVKAIKRILGSDQRNRGPFLRGLFACRLAAGLSQAELAERARVARTTIRGLESGNRRAYVATLRRLSEALEVSPADLLTAEAAEEE
jgi:DNA-binding XRE family transcriptional regulator